MNERSCHQTSTTSISSNQKHLHFSKCFLLLFKLMQQDCNLKTYEKCKLQKGFTKKTNQNNSNGLSKDSNRFDLGLAALERV